MLTLHLMEIARTRLKPYFVVNLQKPNTLEVQKFKDLKQVTTEQYFLLTERMLLAK